MSIITEGKYQPLPKSKPSVRPNSLQALFGHASFDARTCAHLAIDIQESFLSPDPGIARRRQMEPVSRRIANDVAPAFHAAGVKTYWVWMDDSKTDPALLKMREEIISLLPPELRPKQAGPLTAPDFYLVRPAPGDGVVQKTEVSAFKGSDIDAQLKQEKVKTLFLTGFFAAACVRATAESAVGKGYNVVILEDCTDPYYAGTSKEKARLMAKGIIFAPSQDVLPQFKK
jgi:nicotinamidase-related amidase